MKWVEARVIVDYSLYQDMDTALNLVSGVFYDAGVSGVTIESPEYEKDIDWAPDAADMPDHYAVAGYFSKNHRLNENCLCLESGLKRINEENGIISRVFYRDVNEEDWAESWKKFFYPRKISGRFVIKPTWREYEAEEGEEVLELDPGMAFGTGTHPTTRLCIHFMEAYLRPGDCFLDVGTGSGILMIAADKLGASRMTGVDKDEDAVAVAAENMAQNRIPEEKYSLAPGYLTEGIGEKFDFIAANILTEVILQLLPALPGLLAEGGIFVCSGIIGEKRQWVAEEMEKQGFRIYEIRSEEDWIAFAAGLSDKPPEK